MIFDKIEHAERYLGISANLDTALRYMEPGVICEPTEPHLPGAAVDGQERQIRKAVVKVRR